MGWALNLPSIRTELVAMSKTAELHGQQLLAYLIEMAILEIDQQLAMRSNQPFGQIEADPDPNGKGNF